MSLSTALSVALSHHKGYCIYHSRQQCVAVLSAVEAAKPCWYDDACGAFLHAVKNVKLYGGHAVEKESLLHPIIVLEGLDGSGKTTVATELIGRIGATLVRTPHPRFEDNVREHFRNLPEPISRAFYCAANYLAAEEVNTLRQTQPVLMDRWWGSTCSMALAGRVVRQRDEAKASNPDDKAPHPPLASLLPPRDSYVYQWPSDLLKPTHGIVLDVDEAIRRQRAERRGGMRPEEHALAAKEEMRRAVKLSYEYMNMYHFVQTPTWPLTVNAVIDLLESSETSSSPIAKGTARRCTAEEIAAVQPF